MNHQLIKKVLKILSMMAFAGIIGYQLYNIIVNGGSKTKNEDDDTVPEAEPEEYEEYEEDDEVVPVNPTQAYNNSYNGSKGMSSGSYPTGVPVTSNDE